MYTTGLLTSIKLAWAGAADDDRVGNTLCSWAPCGAARSVDTTTPNEFIYNNNTQFTFKGIQHWSENITTHTAQADESYL